MEGKYIIKCYQHLYQHPMYVDIGLCHVENKNIHICLELIIEYGLASSNSFNYRLWKGTYIPIYLFTIIRIVFDNGKTFLSINCTTVPYWFNSVRWHQWVSHWLAQYFSHTHWNISTDTKKKTRAFDWHMRQLTVITEICAEVTTQCSIVNSFFFRVMNNI